MSCPKTIKNGPLGPLVILKAVRTAFWTSTVSIFAFYVSGLCFISLKPKNANMVKSGLLFYPQMGDERVTAFLKGSRHKSRGVAILAC